jgi:hypothetical protein
MDISPSITSSLIGNENEVDNGQNIHIRIWDKLVASLQGVTLDDRIS